MKADNGETYILAEALMEKVMKIGGFEHYEVLATSQTRAATLLRAFKVIWGVMAVVRNSVRSQVASPVRLSP